MSGRRMIQRYLQALAQHFPIVSLIGPRQAGKASLCFEAFPRSRYVALERPDRRESLREDPVAFLSRLPKGCVIDGGHRMPELLPAAAEVVANRPRPGRFILLGARPLLAEPSEIHGAHSRLWLLPLSLRERPIAGMTLDEVLWTGGFPDLLSGRLPADAWFAAYVGRFLDHDLRSLLDVADPELFLRFFRALAACTGELLNVNGVARDVGIAHGTARAWLAALEAALLVLPAPAWSAPDQKRLVKARRLHLVDSGLACWLNGIKSPKELARHPLRPGILQSFVWIELLKSQLNRAAFPALSHFRDRKGNAVDIVSTGQPRVAIQVITGTRVASSLRTGLQRYVGRAGDCRKVCVHGGEDVGRLGDIELVPWRDLDQLLGARL